MARKRKSSPGPYLRKLVLRRDTIEDFAKYPFCLPAIRELEDFDFHAKVTFLVGENGMGKSTLLEAIAVASGLNPEGGSRNFNFNTRASHSPLADHIRISRSIADMGDSFFLRAESFFNVATQIERLDDDPLGGPPIISYYGGVSLHEQSHGESFIALFEKRFRANGLYILDEPESALSPRRQLRFLSRMHQLIQQGCQFVIATHSPIIMSYPDAQIYQLSSEGIRSVEYTQSEHYLITLGFLRNHQRMLCELFEKSEESPPEESS